MPMTQDEIMATGDRWLLTAPATIEQINDAERHLGIHFPTEMKELLVISNGVSLPHPMLEDPAEAAANGVESLFGLDRQILETTHFRLHWLSEGGPKSLPYADRTSQVLIVAEDGNGNYIAYSPIGREHGGWGLGLLDHETREYEPWEDFGLLDLLAELHW